LNSLFSPKLFITKYPTYLPLINEAGLYLQIKLPLEIAVAGFCGLPNNF